MKICIIMSTYNGTGFLKEQLDSIIEQAENRDMMIYVRDDGSSDDTTALLREYSSAHKETGMIINEGSNIGAAGSFLTAIRECPMADIYAFCDQDDKWESGKLDAAIKALDGIDVPALWISDYSVADEKLDILIKNSIVEPCLNQLKALFFNNIPGCVMVFNRLLLEEIRKIRVERIRMHDIMTLNTALITGTVIYDRNPYIRYRQHAGNALGFGNKQLKLKGWLGNKLKLLADKEPYDISEYAREVLRIWGSRMDDSTIREYELISSYRGSLAGRLKLLSRPYTKDEFGRTSLSIRCKILLGLM